MKPFSHWPRWLKVAAVTLLLAVLFGAAQLMITLDQGITAKG